jgi:HicB family
LNDGILDEPPEAAAEESPGSTLYIRVPTSLKNRIEALAKEADLSLNAWTMRCVERCAEMDRVGDLLGEIMQTGMSYRCGTSDSEAHMISHMHEQAEEIAQILGWRGKARENLATNAMISACHGTSGHRRWKHENETDEAAEDGTELSHEEQRRVSRGGDEADDRVSGATRTPVPWCAGDQSPRRHHRSTRTWPRGTCRYDSAVPAGSV